MGNKAHIPKEMEMDSGIVQFQWQEVQQNTEQRFLTDVFIENALQTNTRPDGLCVDTL